MKLRYFLFIVFMGSLVLPVFAAEWLDEFEGPELHEEWVTITWRPAEEGTAIIEDGQLLLNSPSDFGHVVFDGRPLMLRKAPKGDFSISTLIDTEPPVPSASYWIGLFVVGEDGDDAALAGNWAAAAIGGGANEVKSLIGSMIDSTWNDKGHFDVPEWPLHIKLEKVGAQYTGYFKEKVADEWTKAGAAWVHAGMEDPALVGIGFVNNWGGGPDLTLIADYFSLEGDKVTPMAVQPMDKLPDIWGRIKTAAE